MLTVFNKRPSMIAEGEKAAFRPNFFIQVLIFAAIFVVTQIASGIPIVIYSVVMGVIAGMRGEIPVNDNGALDRFAERLQGDIILLSLFSTILAAVLVIVYCRFIEKRSLRSIGFVKDKAVSDYLTGMVVGFVMFGACVLTAYLFGTLTYKGFVLGKGAAGLLLAFFAGFVIQGMSEEVFLRGYFMVSVAGRNSLLLAVVSNSLLFSLLHIMNDGITLLSIINLILFGIFASIYTLKANSIWGICAVHTVWNFSQGNVFGIKVSGIDTRVSLFSFESTQEGSLINGGAFGLEGGLAVTAVLLIGIIVIMNVKGRGISDSDSEHDSPIRAA